MTNLGVNGDPIDKWIFHVFKLRNFQPICSNRWSTMIDAGVDRCRSKAHALHIISVRFLLFHLVFQIHFLEGYRTHC